MSRILDLYEKRNKAVADARAFLDGKGGENGILSAEDSAAYDRIEAEILALGREIDRENRFAAINASLNLPTSQPIVNSPAKSEDAKTGRASDEYRRRMLEALRSYFRKISDVLETGIDESGGYLIPEEYDRRLIDGLNEENIMRKLGTKLRTSGEHNQATMESRIL